MMGSHAFAMVNLTDRKSIKWQRRPLAVVDTNWMPLPGNDNDLEDTMSPVKYFYRYIPTQLFEEMAEFTNIYALQQGTLNFDITNGQELQVLVGLHIMMGALKFPRVHLYWDKALGLNFFNAMTKNRFFKLWNHLHLVNNLEHDKSCKDRLFKVRPIFQAVQKRCKELDLEQKLCVDEQMVPFKGTLSVKQYIKGKPYKWGVKIFMLCGESGLCYDFIIYQGKTTEIEEGLQKTFGFGGAVVLHLSERIYETGNQNHQLYFDNYFTNFNMLQALKHKNILAAGTARANRLSKPPTMTDKEVLKQERG
ncbi:piggyBac transposable element-derived protein 3-like [Ischnura elegans]|uniref:piggyBac transposable element-derived protein 3-like n=1 Tax=Ischnura elegans TaxID=197161 RepID=UPI001ED8A1A4|nr:piggyBac transposable element-derived protein 3-like [Ischnura elegans]